MLYFDEKRRGFKMPIKYNPLCGEKLWEVMYLESKETFLFKMDRYIVTKCSKSVWNAILFRMDNILYNEYTFLNWTQPKMLNICSKRFATEGRNVMGMFGIELMYIDLKNYRYQQQWKICKPDNFKVVCYTSGPFIVEYLAYNW